jgi:hypothetical protein
MRYVVRRCHRYVDMAMKHICCQMGRGVGFEHSGGRAAWRRRSTSGLVSPPNATWICAFVTHATWTEATHYLPKRNTQPACTRCFRNAALNHATHKNISHHAPPRQRVAPSALHPSVHPPAPAYSSSLASSPPTNAASTDALRVISSSLAAATPPLPIMRSRRAASVLKYSTPFCFLGGWGGACVL